MASEPKAGEVQRRDDGCYVYVGAFPMREWVRCSTPAALSLSAELSAAREMREVLKELQWSSEHHHEDSDCGHGYPVCPECGSGVPVPKWGAPPGLDMGHAPDCRLARLIGGGG